MDQQEEVNVSRIIVAYKFIYGAFELVAGLVIAFFAKQMLALYLLKLSQELSEDPHDVLANLSKGIVPGLFTHNGVITITLIGFGMTKVIGAIGLLYKKNWGVDLLVGLTVILLPFQLVSLIIHPSFFDLFYIVMGVIIALYLTHFRPHAWVSRVLERL